MPKDFKHYNLVCINKTTDPPVGSNKVTTLTFSTYIMVDPVTLLQGSNNVTTLTFNHVYHGLPLTEVTLLQGSTRFGAAVGKDTRARG